MYYIGIFTERTIRTRECGVSIVNESGEINWGASKWDVKGARHCRKLSETRAELVIPTLPLKEARVRIGK